MIVVYDKEWMVNPLRTEYKDATFMRIDDHIHSSEDEILVAITRPSLSWLEEVREKTAVLSYFYGAGCTLTSTVLLLCDEIIVQTERQRDAIISLNPHKEVRILATPVLCVMTLARDNAKYVDEYSSCIKSVTDFCLHVCILENDSTDGTAGLLTKALPASRIFSMQLGIPRLPGGRTIERTKKLALLRNRLTDLADIECGEFVVVLDTQVKWDPTILKSHVDLLRERPDIAMVTSWGTVRRSEPCEFHFDTFATIVDGHGPLGFDANVFPCCSAGNKHDFQCHRRSSTRKPIFSGKDVVEVEAGCGGMFVVRTDVMKMCKWDVTDPKGCEHWEFCKQVRKHGKIVINPIPGAVSWEG